MMLKHPKSHHRLGDAAKGGDACCKVSVQWTLEQFEAINRRVVKRRSTFAKEARRLMDIGLGMDSMPATMPVANYEKLISAARKTYP